MNITLSRPFGIGRLLNWLLLTAVIALLILLFARKIIQLSLPGLGVQVKTATSAGSAQAVVDPKCPTLEQKEVIDVMEFYQKLLVSLACLLRTR